MPPLENEDAQVAPSTTENEQTQNITESQDTDSSTVDTTQSPPSQQQDAKEGAGSNIPPHQNIVAEAVRKAKEEMRQETMLAVREAMLGFTQNQGVQQQAPKQEEAKYKGYTQTQLEQIQAHPEATEQDKLFAIRGLAVIEAKQETLNSFRTERENAEKQTRQGQAIQEIIKDYPQTFNRASGQWNFADPLFQKAMQTYNSDPRLQAYGNEGLRVAMDRAYAQMAREGQLKTVKKEVKLNSQQRLIDKNQSQALNAGTLTPVKQNGTEKSKAALLEAYKNNPGNTELRNAALGHLVPKSWYA